MSSLFHGVALFFRGIGWVARHPGRWLFGLIPALIAFALYVAAFAFLILNVGGLAETFTPFADSWAEGWRNTVRIAVGVLLVGAGLAIAVFTFVAVTLIIGEPFYEKLSEQVDEDLGGVVHGPEVSLLRSIGRSIRDSLITLGWVLVFTVPLFFLGFIPVIGQTVIPVLGAMVSGFFLTVEMSSVAFERRGILRKQRFALLRAHKALAVGFGTAMFLVFLIPFLAVLAMPGAVAGATMLVRRITAPLPYQPYQPGPNGPR
ncbi:EI24 domain-containing protein [Rhizohabitans arisaemae]|uniref:EI24 domain-containing protein n=1 Tax=Rhizohabitans arisaemae TaxID=2720610 RepID=UPI0024B097E5|nr:EI24 domain-containing protein [Rhizohabitans arisaemae]